ncbi:MAG: hypothetical protein ACWGNB_09555 [Thiogranum sp.]
MKQQPLALLFCLTASVPAALTFSTDVAAMAADQPLIAGTEATPDFSGVARPAPPEHPGAARADDGSQPPPTPSAGATEAAATGAQSIPGIPCLNDFNTDEQGGGAENPTSCQDAGGQKRLSFRFGNGMADHSDLLGEVDGVRVDYRLRGGLDIEGLAGYPVVSETDRFNTDRQVLGFSADSGKVAGLWDFNSYFIQQQAEGKADSRAAGAAVRYLRAKRSLLLLLDYDLANDALGAFTASGALALPLRTTFSATFDLRNTPLDARQQKYLQRSMASMEGWTWDLPTDRMKHHATVRSDEIATLSLGLTHTFSERFRLSGSFAMLEAYDETLADGSTGAALSEYFYSLKLTGKDLVFSGTQNRLDLSHRITDTSRVSSAAINSNYAINRRWKVSPRVRTDYQDNLLDRSAQWRASPSVKMEYRWRGQYGLDIEAGGEWSAREFSNTETSQSSYFVSLGYKANF